MIGTQTRTSWRPSVRTQAHCGGRAIALKRQMNIHATRARGHTCAREVRVPLEQLASLVEQHRYEVDWDVHLHGSPEGDAKDLHVAHVAEAPVQLGARHEAVAVNVALEPRVDLRLVDVAQPHAVVGRTAKERLLDGPPTALRPIDRVVHELIRGVCERPRVR